MLTIPALYEKMDTFGMLNCKDSRYLWVFDMKWIPISELSPEPDIYVGDTPLTTFARGMGGDYWCFFPGEDLSEPAVCFCEHTEWDGSWFAASLSDAIFREIVFYCSTSCFDDKPTVSENEQTVQALLRHYTAQLKDILPPNQIAILKDLSKKPLTWQATPYGTWHALLSGDEAEQIISSAIGFSQLNHTFPIRWADNE